MMWNRHFDTMYGWGDWSWFGPFHFVMPLLFSGLIIAANIFVARRAFWSKADMKRCQLDARLVAKK